MSVFILSFFLMIVIIGAMAIGVIVKNKPIKGSCGGLNNVGIDGSCVICGKPQEETLESDKASLFYDAMAKKKA